MMRITALLLRIAPCPRCGGSGGHYEVGTWVSCWGCGGTGQR
ncbi:hypothetical protein CJ469_06427 [Nocardia farcinica]|nr:hypothetical protein CJ469_06427 [Nocardia farcinica]PFW98298.1 hypothetical protein CJ468_06461 [Nocardia farcinica]